MPPKKSGKKNNKSKNSGYTSDEPYNSEEDYASQSDSASEIETYSSGGSESESDSAESGESDDSYESGESEESDAGSDAGSDAELESGSEMSGGESDEDEESEYDETDEDEEYDDTDEDEVEDEAGDEDGEEADVDAEEDGMPTKAKDTRACYLKDIDKDIIAGSHDDSMSYGKMQYKRIDDDDRITDSTMTYYELVRCIGTRAQQFNRGAPPLIKGIDHLHSAKKAYVEITMGMTPFIIRRHLPGKKYEEWKLMELQIIHEITDDFFVPGDIDWDNLIENTDKIKKLLFDRPAKIAKKTTKK